MSLDSENLKAKRPYIGRFAPSPSGGLHFGSLLSAVGSYVDAKANQGQWLLRIDNIDPPREIPGADQKIIKTLDSFELSWDQSVIYQGSRIPSYFQACIELIKNDQVYPCTCSRKKLADHPQYPGHCRRGLNTREKDQLIQSLEQNIEQFQNQRQIQDIINIRDFSLRLKTENTALSDLDFVDQIQGPQRHPKHFGDFIILRKDGLPSYMLACGLDDLNDNISHIIRGSDLLEANFWQRHLQGAYLRLNSQGTKPSFKYCHLPIVTNELEQKLSKQHFAEEIDPTHSKQLIFECIKALGQTPPKELRYEAPSIQLLWATEHWNIARIPTGPVPISQLNIANNS